MKFIANFHLPVTAPYTRAKEAEGFRSSLELAKQAEDAGFYAVSAPEHHFLENYSHSAAPEVFLSAVAARTSRIKLMHAVRLLPNKYNHPIRAAECAAALDLASEGRLIFGVGRSTTALELDGFGIDTATTRDQMRDSMEIIRKAWDDEPFSHDGLIKVPERNVFPKPVQRPHPPIYYTGGTPASVQVAGRAGYGASCFTFALESMVAARDAYMAAADGLAPAEDGELVMPPSANPIREFMIGLMPLVGTASDTVDLGLEHNRAFMQLVFTYISALTEAQKSSYEYLQKSLSLSHPPAEASKDELLAHPQLAFGDPDQVIAKIQAFVDLGFDTFWTNILTTLPHERNVESIRLFGEYVIPYFESLAAKNGAGASSADGALAMTPGQAGAPGNAR